MFNLFDEENPHLHLKRNPDHSLTFMKFWKYYRDNFLAELDLHVPTNVPIPPLDTPLRMRAVGDDRKLVDIEGVSEALIVGTPTDGCLKPTCFFGKRGT